MPYYEARLKHYEGLDPGRCGERELLADLVEEGYTDTAALLWDRTGAAGRLQRFLGVTLEILGPPPERQRFYLIREPVRV